MRRRAFVRGTAALTAVGIGVAGGCLGGSSGDGGSGGDGSSGGAGAGDAAGAGEAATGDGTPTEPPVPVAASGGPAPQAVREYLADAGNFDGAMADRTGMDEVPVAVGSRGNGGYYAFGPPAVRIDAGATVRWEWTGKGGAHDVVAASGADFASVRTGERRTFSRTFDAPGVVTYYCTPHRSLGMKGAVVVE